MGTPTSLREESIEAAGESVHAVVLNMGNPQVRPPRPAARTRSGFISLGKALEHHRRFPEGTNVEFAHVETPTASAS